MRKEAIKEAATLEEAKEAAAREIGLDVQTAQFEILQMPQKKTLGLFGGCPARVKAFAEVSRRTKRRNTCGVCCGRWGPVRFPSTSRCRERAVY